MSEPPHKSLALQTRRVGSQGLRDPGAHSPHWSRGLGRTHPKSNLPGVFRGPGEGTLKFCGVRAVTGLWEGCGEGLGRKLLGEGAGPELQQRKGGTCVGGTSHPRSRAGRGPPAGPT